jgi:hypothetical protein
MTDVQQEAEQAKFPHGGICCDCGDVSKHLLCRKCRELRTSDDDRTHELNRLRAQVEFSDQHISQLEEAIDVLLQAENPLTPFEENEWLSAVALLKHARGVSLNAAIPGLTETIPLEKSGDDQCIANPLDEEARSYMRQLFKESDKKLEADAHG